MLVLSNRPQVSLSAESWSHTIDTALRAAGQRILWRRALRMSALSLPFVVVAIAAYITLLRFSVTELHAWPVFFVFVPWLLFIWLWTRAQRVTSAEAARFLDRTLNLDERVSTCIELINSSKHVRTQVVHSGVHRALLIDAADALAERLDELPAPFSFRWTRLNAISVAVALVALLCAVAFPTYVELARVERSALAKAVQDQLVQVRAMRSEIEGNQQISAELKASILNELATLEQKLASSSLDQAAGIATLADAEQRLRSLLRTPSADFDGLVAAAQLVWTVAAQNFEWDVEQVNSTSDLGRAAEASLFLGDNLLGMNPDQERRVSFSLERASSQASGRDPELSKQLVAASTGVRTRDHAPASRALAQSSRMFAEADSQREDAVALEHVLSQLNKGREEIAEAGRPQTKKAQVGFRRRGPSAGSTTPTPDLEDFGTGENGAQTGQAGSQSISNVSGMGPVVGQSNVASYSGAPSSSGSGGKPAQTGGQDGPGSPGSAPGGGTDGQDAGQAGGSQQTAGGGTAGGAASDSGEQGTLSGSITGPVGGVGGAISHVPNPSGRGNAPNNDARSPEDAEDSSSDGGDEQVYVPGPGASEDEDAGASASTESNNNGEDPSADGVGGRIGEGDGNGAELSSGTGQGGAVRVQTPYREVIAEYARQATEAIDRAYVPPDAKQYVKEYFSELGK